LSSLHLFKNRLMFNLICKVSNNFLHENLIHCNILVHKSWKLHQIFKFGYWNFDIYSISIYFLNYTKRMQQLQLHPIEYLWLSTKPHVLNSIKNLKMIYKNQHFLHFLYFIYMFTYVFLFFTILMRIGFQWCVSTYKKCWRGKGL
jgi:hypothetical protein